MREEWKESKKEKGRKRGEEQKGEYNREVKLGVS